MAKRERAYVKLLLTNAITDPWQEQPTQALVTGCTIFASVIRFGVCFGSSKKQLGVLAMKFTPSVGHL
jgi:hypothetical protein